MLTMVLVLAVGIAPADWYTFAPEGKNFRIELPSKPDSSSTRPIPNAPGSELTVAQLKTSNGVFSIKVSENRGKVDPKTLDDGIRRFATDKKATLGAIKPVTAVGNPGREFEMTEPSGSGLVRSKTRWVASGNSLFMLMVAGTPGAQLPVDADRFLGSLKIGAVNTAVAARETPDAAPVAEPASGDTVTSTKPPFTIHFPEEAQTRDQTTPGSKGVTKQTTYSCKVDGALFSIVVTAEPELVRKGAEKSALDRSRADYMRVGRLKPANETRLETNGYSGVEFMTRAPGLDGKKFVESRVRFYVMDGLIVTLSAVSAPEMPLPPEADAFFRSFRPGETTAKDSAPEKADVASDDEPKSKADAGADAKSKTAEKKSAAPSRVVISRMPRGAKPYPNEDLVNLQRSFVERERDGFRDVGPAGSVLVGVRVSYIERFGGPKVRSVQPIFRSGKNYYAGQIHGEVVGPVNMVVAKPGYAVGGLVTHTGLTLDGFGIVFMKVDGDRLDPTDSYKSPWIGDKQGGGPGEVTSRGGLVVGLQGRSGAEVNGLGLTTLK
jgi:hypothetical protein